MFNLEGKNALLTGATGGIGLSIAELLVASGAKVVLSSPDFEKLEQICDQFGNAAVPLYADLSNREEIEGLYAKAEKLIGMPIGVLICNAGIVKDSLAVRMKQYQWDEVIEINLTSIFRLNQDAVKCMMSQKWGRIINISSIIGYTGNAGQSNYAAAKAGLIGMSKSFAREYATYGITVNCVAPGFIDTPMTSGLSKEVKDNILGNIPMKRMGSAKEVANAVLFLASDESAYITGSTIHVNGGMLMV